MHIPQAPDVNTAARAEAPAAISDPGPRRRATKRRAAGVESDRGRKRVVVVGNGMVSHHLCAALVREGAAVDIVVFGEEGVPAYDRVHLGDVLRGRSSESLLLAPPEWYDRNGIALHLDDCVVGLDLARHTVRSARGCEVTYDALVLATGAAPVFPRIEVDAGSRVFVLRTIDDFERVRASLPCVRRAVVIGGGLLGVETASALRGAQVDVAVVEHGPRLLHRLLDVEASRVLGGRLKRAGIALRATAEVRAIRHGEDGARVELASGETLPADLVIIAAGAAPRDDLARAGLATDPHGGFVVDELLRTSDPDVYAVGDCASAAGAPCGAITPGYQMADCLARTLAGRATPFRSAARVVRVEAAGVTVLVAGAPPSHSGRVISVSDGQSFRQVVVRDGRVVRAVAIGPWDGWARIEEAIRSDQVLPESRIEAFARGDSLWGDTPFAAALGDEALVCVCNAVSAGTIRCAVAEGCATATEIAARTGAGSSCGGCTVTVERLLTGATTAGERSPRALISVVIAALMGAALLAAGRPLLEAAPAVQGAWDLVLRDPHEQRVTGYAALALAGASVSLPLARSVPRLRRWLARWRVVHGAVGAATLLLLALHTGLRAGQGVNALLTAAFVGVAVSGATAGLAFARRVRPAPRTAVRIVHVALFWLAAALLAVHVVAVYYF